MQQYEGADKQVDDGRERLAGAAVGRLSAAYLHLDPSFRGFGDVSTGLSHAQAMGRSLAQGRPALVDSTGLFGALRFETAEKLEMASVHRVPGLFEEVLAAAIVLAAWEAETAAEERTFSLRVLPHHPPALRLCLGIACVQAATFTTDSPLRRALLRRGQYCLARAQTDSTQDLVGAIASRADPWVSTRKVEVRKPGPDLATNETDEDTSAGYVSGIRRHKRTVFIDVDLNGSITQIALPADTPIFSGEDRLQTGDHLAVRGHRQLSHAGEPTLFVERIDRLVRGQQPPKGSGDRLFPQASALHTVRDRLQRANFLEQITPTLGRFYEGGAARPYITWVNQARRSSFLRVSSELRLVQSLSAGVQRCYEIGSSFRNEGRAGAGHDEFLMLEAYALDLGLDEMTDFMVDLMAACVFGQKGQEPPRATIRFDQAVHEITGIEMEDEKGIRRAVAGEVGSYAASRPLHHALQIFLDSVVAPAYPGIVVFTHPPMPSSPLIEGDGEEAARHWIYVEGLDCAEVARNETDVDALAIKLDEQHRADPFCVPRDYTDFLSAVATLPSPPVGVGVGMSRIIDLRAGTGAASNVL